MAVTIKEIETLQSGDYIEASELYFKVLKLDTKKKELTLTAAFTYGSRVTGKWISTYNDEIAKRDRLFWNIIRANSKEAKGIEKRLRR